MLISLGVLVITLAVGSPGTTNPGSVISTKPVSIAVQSESISALADCSQACQEMRDSQNHLITYFCVPVPGNAGEGTGCSATISECTITTSTSCGIELPGDSELFLASTDGRVLSSIAICSTAHTVIKDERIDFAHARQREALVYRAHAVTISEGQ